jgi:hypothetical protein
MCLENIDSSLLLAIIQAIAMILLVTVTIWYAISMNKTVQEMRIDRKIKLLEKKLEKLYLPLKRNFKHVVWKPDISTEMQHPMEIASFEKFWDEINKYCYLASEKLDPLLFVILKGVSASITYVEEKENFNRTRFEFINVINDDIDLYRKELDRLIN